jgi:hypothetical protein
LDFAAGFFLGRAGALAFADGRAFGCALRGDLIVRVFFFAGTAFAGRRELPFFARATFFAGAGLPRFFGAGRAFFVTFFLPFLVAMPGV